MPIVASFILSPGHYADNIWQSLAKLCDKACSAVSVIHIENCGGYPNSSVVVAQASCVKWLETVLIIAAVHLALFPPTRAWE